MEEGDREKRKSRETERMACGDMEKRQGRAAGEDGGGGWSDLFTRQGTARSACHQALEARKRRERLSPRAFTSRKSMTLPTP